MVLIGAPSEGDQIKTPIGSRIPFGDHPLKSERYREDSHGPGARMTRTNREVYQTGPKKDGVS